MNKKEISELKRRFTKEGCTISDMAGCYVDATKNKVCTFQKKFLSLEDEEFFKYLEIVKKAMSGTVGNNLLTLSFPTEAETKEDGIHKVLLALRDCALSDEGLLNALYDRIIEKFNYTGNYLITLFYDAYDVPVRTNDNMLLDESTDVYKYIVCCICPVNLSKPALGYREEENVIGPRLRDWVVGPVDTAFTFPAFNDRATDLHSILVYTKDAKEPHREFWEEGLECPGKYTSTQKRRAFSNIIENNVGSQNDSLDEIITDVQENIFSAVEAVPDEDKDDEDKAKIFRKEELTDILKDSGIPESKSEDIVRDYEDFFKEEKPLAKELIDSRVLKNSEAIEEKKNLKKQVEDLKSQLADAGVTDESGNDVDLMIKVRPDKVAEIDTTFVNGVRCLIIPVEDVHTAAINGEIQDL